MSIRFRRKINKLKKSFAKKWYKLMKPLEKYLNSRESRTYENIKENITEDEVVKLTVKYLSRKIAKRSHSLDLMVAKYIDTEEVGGTSFADLYWSIEKRKIKIGFSKYKNDVKFQLKVINKLSEIKGLSVELSDWKPSPWARAEEFNGLYIIKVIE